MRDLVATKIHSASPEPSWIAAMRRTRLVPLACLVFMVLALASPTALAGTPADGNGPAGSADSDGDQLTDAFEARYGATRPDSKDSDGDGLRDAAEDHDDDRLGNLGEQRFGTSPIDADTDGDGIRDGAEDSDGDGKSNALEQDSRRVPSRLVPRLGNAYVDRPPAYGNGCHSGPYDAQIHPCVFGDAGGSVRVAIFGDSHALQWLPALTRGAASRGWRIVSITKSACPSVHVVFQQPTFSGATPSCTTWRQRGERWLANHPQDLVIISNARGYRVVDGHGDRLPPDQKQRRWRRGLEQTIESLPSSQKVLVLGDAATPGRNVPPCLKRNPGRISACVRSRKASIAVNHDKAERAAANATGATFRSMNSKVCPYDPCPVIVNELLIWRDGSHITATYAAQLAPSLRSIIREVLEGP